MFCATTFVVAAPCAFAIDLTPSTPAGMEALADAYVSGNGVPKDTGKAIGLYKRAAEQNNTSAANSLGLLYQQIGDLKEALVWLEKAAVANNADAAFNAGVAFTKRGVWPDGAKAAFYFQKAADLGRADALHELGMLYERGRAVKQDSERARQFYEKAVAARVKESVSSLATMYVEGRGIPQDIPKGLELLRDAAERGNQAAAVALASYYEKGQ